MNQHYFMTGNVEEEVDDDEDDQNGSSSVTPDLCKTDQKPLTMTQTVL